jgi:hypothetical protein
MEVQAIMGKVRHVAQQQLINNKKKNLRALNSKPLEADNDRLESIEPSDMLERNRRRILALRTAISELEARATSMLQKAFSKEVLPPMDGFHHGHSNNMSAGHSGGGGQHHPSYQGNYPAGTLPLLSDDLTTGANEMDEGLGVGDDDDLALDGYDNGDDDRLVLPNIH